MSELGFKQITVLNWQEQDEVLSFLSFGRTSPADGRRELMTPEEWVMLFLKPKLNKDVPIEIARLFEVARGTLVYGYFFYPLFTLGIEQMYRVAEAAIYIKSRQAGASKSQLKDFDKCIAFLCAKGLITDKAQWDAVRHLRNYTSHPKNQEIHMPIDALRELNQLTTEINSLYV